MIQKTPIFKKYFFASILGNLFEHYETALFGLLSPFLAPLFFPDKDEITGLILTYLIMIIAIISKPIGAFVFGKIGDKQGRKKALSITILGMAITTGLIGCIPTYLHIGKMAPILLALIKIFQNFFASGETIGGAIFLLENYPGKKKNFMSSLYATSTIGGFLLASLMISLFSYLNIMQTHWRILFLLSPLTCLIGFFIRRSFHEQPIEKKVFKLKNLLKENSLEFFAIFFAAGFSYATFSIIFTFMNGFIPLISSLTKSQMIGLNSLLLFLDLALLPFFGYLADVFSKEKIMLLGSGVAAIFCYPIHFFLSSPTLFSVIFIRIFLVLVGVCFSAPFHHWSQNLINQKTRYTTIALGYVLGSQILGAPASTVSLWMFQKTKWIASSGIYLTIIASIAFIFLLPLSKAREEKYLQ